MSSATELEKLVVRLVGDSSSYDKMLKGAEKQTKQSTDKIAKDLSFFDNQVRASMSGAEKSTIRFNSRMQEVSQITRAVRTPTEQYAREVARLRGHLRKGRISQETYNRALLEAKKILPPAAKDLSLFGRQAKASMGALEKSTMKASARLQEAGQIIRSVRTPTEQYAREVARLRSHLRKGRISQETYNRALKQAKKSLPSVISLLGKYSSKLKSVGQGLQRVGRRMTLMVTLPLAGMAVASIVAFASFDDAMTKSLAIMGDVTDEMRERMEQAALDISSVSVTPPKDLAEAFFFLASAGLSAEESMASLATVERFAVAGAFDMALATDLLTDAQTAMGLASEDAGQNLLNLKRISDVFVKANQIANTSVQQVAEAMTADAGTAARNFGASLETTVAILAAYASAGKKGAEAGNLFGRMTRLLTKAQRDNADEFEKLEIRVKDTDGGYRNLIDILGDMEFAFKDMKKPQRDASLELLGFQALAQKAITPLLGLNKEMKRFEQRVLNTGDATKEVADKQLKSFSSQLKILKNNITIAAIEVGKILAPTIKFLADKLMIAVKWFKNLSDTTKKWIVGILAAVGGLGPLLIIVGSLIGAIAGVVAVIGVMMSIGIKVIAIIVAIVVAMSIWIAVIASVVVAVVAFVAYLIGPDSLASAWGTVKDKAQSAFQFIKGFMSNFGQNMRILLDWLKTNWAAVLLDMGKAFLFFARNMGVNTLVAVKIFMRMFEALKGFMTQWAAKASNAVARVQTKIMVKMAIGVTKFAEKAWDNVKKIFSGKKALPAKDIEAMGKKFMTDFQRGVESEDILKTLKEIFDEERGGFVSPLAGFTSQLTVPEFNMTSMQQEVEKTTEKIDTYKDAIEAAAKAVKALVKIDKELVSSLKDSQKSLLEQVATFGLTSREADILKLSLRGATTAQLEQARSLDSQLTVMEQYQKQVEAAKNLTEEFMSPLDKFKKQQAEFEALFDTNLISVETFNKAMQKMEDSLKKENKIKFSVSGIQAVEAGTAEAAARLEAFRALAKAPVDIPVGLRKDAMDDENRKGVFRGPDRAEFVAKAQKAAQADLGKLMMQDTETQKAILAASEKIVVNTDPKKGNKKEIKVADMEVAGT